MTVPALAVEQIDEEMVRRLKAGNGQLSTPESRAAYAAENGIPWSEPLDWRDLATKDAPAREWAIEHWFGMGHVTLLAGAGGIGKTAVAQAMGSCLALRREYLDWPTERRVLLWAAEDEAAELWRRQIAIAKWLNVPLEAFAGKFFAHSYCGEQVELAGLVDYSHRLVATSMMTTLREQIGDYKADVVMLDNVARLFAGNENDRHQVTSFVAMLTGAAPQAAILLLGHPGKAQGSEYSGSTAWEGSVRARLYLGRTLPDATDDDGERVEDDGTRYLCRRKANYSALDWRRLKWMDGVMVPEVREPGTTRTSPDYARDVVVRAMRKLAEMGEHGVASTASSKYLPKLARQYQLLENISEKAFGTAMREMRMAGAITVGVVGKYTNRTPREGLVLVSDGVHK